MRALLRTELLKLTTVGAPWAVMLVAAATTAATCLQVVLSAGRGGRPSIGTAGALLDLLETLTWGTWASLVLGVLVVTTEHRHRTVTASVLQVPRRWRLVAAKLVAAAVAGCAVAVLCLAVVAAAGLPSGVLLPERVNGDVVLRSVGLLLTYPVYAGLGVAVGALLPATQPVAVVVPLAWLVVVERLVTGPLSPSVPPWTLGGVTAAVQNVGTLPRLLPLWLAGSVLGVYVVGLLVLGTVRAVRMDLT